MWAKIITIKRTKDLNYFSLCALNLFNTWVSQLLSWITEINELFHDILIYWDAPVDVMRSSSYIEASDFFKCHKVFLGGGIKLWYTALIWNAMAFYTIFAAET